MNKENFKQFSAFMNVAAKLTKCSIKRCNATMEKVKENREIQKAKLLAATTFDVKKKKEYINKIVYNKDVINQDKCLYKACRKVYMKMIRSLIRTFENFLKSNLFKSNSSDIKKYLGEIRYLMKKKTLSVSDVNNIQKNKNLLVLNLMTDRNFMKRS